MQAAFLRVKLGQGSMRRTRVGARSRAPIWMRFRGIGLVLPTTPKWAEQAWHLFVVRHAERDAFAARLREAGVATVIHYPIPPHLQPAYADLGIVPGTLPIAEAIHREVISLPIGPTMSDGEVAGVIAAVHAAL